MPSSEPDIDIRNDPISGIWPMLFGGALGIVFVITFFYMIFGSRPLGIEGMLALLIPLGLGAVSLGTAYIGWTMIFDKTPKLSFTKDGFMDHRIKMGFQCVDFLDVRLYFVRTNAHLTTATMFVKVTQHEKDGAMLRPTAGNIFEIAFDVLSLDYSPQTIANLVRQRGIAARAI
jgi:hypothetical protein